MEGNQARKFLKSAELLERELGKEKEEVLRNVLPLIEVTKAFNKVVLACMGAELESDWIKSIEIFQEKYLETDMSVTPKVLLPF